MPSQVGAELECPFGTDDNDLPLLEMGQDLTNNLDTLVRHTLRATQRRRDERRHGASHAGRSADDAPAGGAARTSTVQFTDAMEA